MSIYSFKIDDTRDLAEQIGEHAHVYATEHGQLDVFCLVCPVEFWAMAHKHNMRIDAKEREQVRLEMNAGSILVMSDPDAPSDEAYFVPTGGG